MKLPEMLRDLQFALLDHLEVFLGDSLDSIINVAIVLLSIMKPFCAELNQSVLQQQLFVQMSDPPFLYYAPIINAVPYSVF